MPISIRPITATDNLQWLDLFQSYVNFYETELTDEQYQITWERLIADSEIHGLVAELDGHLVGIAHYLFHASTWATHNYCYLEDLFVSTDVRGGGIGRSLINKVTESALAAGSSRLYWSTREGNSPARILYDKVADLTDFRQYRIRLTNEPD
jgi:GNAT superfamily N-acetyltransferase